MHRPLILFLFLFTVSLSANSQLSEGGMPESAFLPAQKTTVLPEVELDMPEIQIDEISESIPARYGVFNDTLLNLKSYGKSDIIPGKGKIWRLKVRCHEARSIQVVFDKYRVPQNAGLFLYDEGMNRIAGAFTNRNTRDDGRFIIADFKGNHVILEYFEPDAAQFEGELIIGSLGLAFDEPPVQETGPGFININCPIGKDAQLAKHSVCKMTFRSGAYQVTCSGGLINNTESDGTPYFLTANHCLSTQQEAATLVTYFNYEIAGCNGNLADAQTLSGSTLLATGKPSDFTLLVLDNIPPPEYQPFYAGWNKRNNPVDSVTGIHVPYNEYKKISIDYDSIISNPVSVTWDDNSRSPVGSHWIIGFDEGGTSQGSSGSPLFNNSNQIIGQLHGGDDESAYYGKLSYSYSFKSPGLHTIGHYLDPDSTGIMSIDGYVPDDNVPDAFFTTRFDQVCHNTPITLNDNSVFGPYQRTWSIFPATFAFSGGTSETSIDPVIEFFQDTMYTVTLNLSVDGEVVSTEDMQIKSGRINIDVLSKTPADLCDCDFESFDLKGIGGELFKWSILPADLDKVVLSDSEGERIHVSRKPEFESDSSYSVNLKVVGSQSTCLDTVILTFNLLRQVNDNIENAIELDFGTSEYYSNICATTEDEEPVPPFVSCNTQDSWCDEYGTGENIVENSVWFKFVGSPTGIVSISSNGMDNEIALYEADSYHAILAGDYTILGANDDRSLSDYRPLIINEKVNPGATYWLQVDGSGGGSEDEFNLTLLDLTQTGFSEPIAKQITVYPQPAGNEVFLTHPDWIKGIMTEIAVYNTSGILIVVNEIETGNGIISMNIADWEAGVYIAAVKTGNDRYIARIIKR